MSTLSFHEVGLPRAQWKAVEKKAKSAGTTPAAYVRSLIERDLHAESLKEILDPVRADFRKSGVTEVQLESIVRRARKAPRTSARRLRP